MFCPLPSAPKFSAASSASVISALYTDLDVRKNKPIYIRALTLVKVEH